MNDLELLTNLYCIHSKSGNETKMRKFIKRWVSKNIKNAVVSTDKIGNIFVTKGISETYPCICSHIDQVQTNHSKDFRAIIADDTIFGYSYKCRDFQGLGADDKNGIWVALMCLQKFDVIKCAFFVGEEIGCIGSSNCDVNFFADCRFCIQCDRRNGCDLITDIHEQMCSDEFLADIDYADFGYKPTTGLSTDVAELRDRGVTCSCVNLSCGYYNPHTDNEITIISELMNCLNFVEHIIEKCTKTYPYECVYYRRGSFFDDWYLYDNDPYFKAEEDISYAIDNMEIYDEESFYCFVSAHRDKWKGVTDEDLEQIWLDYEHLISYNV